MRPPCRRRGMEGGKAEQLARTGSCFILEPHAGGAEGRFCSQPEFLWSNTTSVATRPFITIHENNVISGLSSKFYRLLLSQLRRVVVAGGLPAPIGERGAESEVSSM